MSDFVKNMDLVFVIFIVFSLNMGVYMFEMIRVFIFLIDIG